MNIILLDQETVDALAFRRWWRRLAVVGALILLVAGVALGMAMLARSQAPPRSHAVGLPVVGAPTGHPMHRVGCVVIR